MPKPQPRWVVPLGADVELSMTIDDSGEITLDRVLFGKESIVCYLTAMQAVALGQALLDAARVAGGET